MWNQKSPASHHQGGGHYRPRRPRQPCLRHHCLLHFGCRCHWPLFLLLSGKILTWLLSSLKRDAASVLQLKAEKKIAPMDTDALVTRDGEKDGQVGNFNLLAFQAIKCQFSW